MPAASVVVSLVEAPFRGYFAARLFVDDVLTQLFPSRQQQHAGLADLESTHVHGQGLFGNSLPTAARPAGSPKKNTRARTTTTAAATTAAPSGAAVLDLDALENELMQVKMLASALGSAPAATTTDEQHAVVRHPLDTSHSHLHRGATVSQQATLAQQDNHRPPAPSGSSSRERGAAPSSHRPTSCPPTEPRRRPAIGFRDVLAPDNNSPSVPAIDVLRILSPNSTQGVPVNNGGEVASSDQKQQGSRTKARVVAARSAPRSSTAQPLKPVAEFSCDEVAVALLSRFGSA